MRAQTDVIERAEWQLNESPELALKPPEYGAELLPPLPFCALQFHRVGIAPIGGDGTAWPMRQQLAGSRIAQGENEIERRSVCAGKVLPGLRIKSVGRIACHAQNVEHQRVKPVGQRIPALKPLKFWP